MHICPSCGTGFHDDEEFCHDCGLKLTLVDPAVSGPDSATTAAGPGASPTPAVTPGTRATPRRSASSSRSPDRPEPASGSAGTLPGADNCSGKPGAAPAAPSGRAAARGEASPGRVGDGQPGGDSSRRRTPAASAGSTPEPPARKRGGIHPNDALAPSETDSAGSGAATSRARRTDPTTDRQLRYRPVYKAPDEWTAVTIKELLRSAGLSALVLAVAEPSDDGIDRLIEGYWGKVLVLESDLEDATRLIGDYLRGLDRSMH